MEGSTPLGVQPLLDRPLAKVLRRRYLVALAAVALVATCAAVAALWSHPAFAAAPVLSAVSPVVAPLVVAVVTSDARADHQDPYAGNSMFSQRDGQPDPSCRSYVAASYITWLRGVGLRPAPLVHTWPRERIHKLLRQVNAVVIPGGDGSQQYSAAVRGVIEEVVAINRGGAYLPLWGTCLGFELLALWSVAPSYNWDGVEETDVLHKLPAVGINLPLTFTAGGRNPSVFFGAEAPAGWLEISSWLQQQPLTVHAHSYSFPYHVWLSHPKLKDFWNVLATSDAGLGGFVALISGKELPFYGVQWHPEKSVAEWNPAAGNAHSFEAVQANVHFAFVLAKQARKSGQRFDSNEAEAAAVSGFWGDDFYTAYNMSTGNRSYFDAVYCFRD